jgi:hypothetical protein
MKMLICFFVAYIYIALLIARPPIHGKHDRQAGFAVFARYAAALIVWFSLVQFGLV